MWVSATVRQAWCRPSPNFCFLLGDRADSVGFAFAHLSFLLLSLSFTQTHPRPAQWSKRPCSPGAVLTASSLMSEGSGRRFHAGVSGDGHSIPGDTPPQNCGQQVESPEKSRRPCDSRFLMDRTTRLKEGDDGGFDSPFLSAGTQELSAAPSIGVPTPFLTNTGFPVAIPRETSAWVGSDARMTSAASLSSLSPEESASASRSRPKRAGRTKEAHVVSHGTGASASATASAAAAAAAAAATPTTTVSCPPSRGRRAIAAAAGSRPLDPVVFVQVRGNSGGGDIRFETAPVRNTRADKEGAKDSVDLRRTPTHGEEAVVMSRGVTPEPFLPSGEARGRLREGGAALSSCWSATSPRDSELSGPTAELLLRAPQQIPLTPPGSFFSAFASNASTDGSDSTRGHDDDAVRCPPLTSPVPSSSVSSAPSERMATAVQPRGPTPVPPEEGRHAFG